MGMYGPAKASIASLIPGSGFQTMSISEVYGEFSELHYFLGTWGHAGLIRSKDAGRHSLHILCLLLLSFLL